MSDGSGMRASSARDFGDSAGYGGGGSTRDYRDVLGEDEARRRPNPLDAVMTIPPHRRREGSGRAGPGRQERDPSADLVTAAGAMLVAGLGVLAWRYAQGRRSQRMQDRRRDDGAAREALARLQV
ncbi:MAG TPA: hypothetical protein VHL98_03355 [Microvirga sp.]|jgi:hypothetical protein|nr:hypothetical protein [Microvirga sp.]